MQLLSIHIQAKLYVEHSISISIKFTDSQIVLHWLNNDNKILKQWVRNRIIEIQRFSALKDWMYIQSSDMIADLGTRKAASLNDINSDSNWVNGFSWMKKEVKEFPAYTIDDIKISSSQLDEVKKESSFGFSAFKVSYNSSTEV